MKDWQKYSAEAFGTFVLVGIGGGVAMQGADAAAVAFAFAVAWMAALHTVGRISGGAFNPVLSLAAFLDRAISAKDLLFYWIAQFVGAIGAIGIFAWLFTRDMTAGAGATFGTFDKFKAFSVEAILVLILTVAFLTLLRSEAHTKYLGMGFALFSVTILGYNLTMAGLNPAKVFAASLLSGEFWGDFWVYLVGPIVGAIAGWVLYRVIVRGDTNFADDLGEIADSVM